MSASKQKVLTVDRVEDGVVIMMDETESITRITADMLGFIPHDGDVLRISVDADGRIRSAVSDPDAAEERRAAMRARLQRLKRSSRMHRTPR